MTIKEIVELTPRQIAGLSDKELRKVTQQLADAGNKRIRRLLDDPLGRSTQITSKIIAEGRENQPYFTVKGKTERGEVRAQFDEVRQFLQKKSQSSIKTIKKIVGKVQKKLEDIALDEGDDIGEESELTDEQILSDPDFWEALDKAKEKLGISEWEHRGDKSSGKAIKKLLGTYRKQKKHVIGNMARALANNLMGLDYNGKPLKKGGQLTESDDVQP